MKNFRLEKDSTANWLYEEFGIARMNHLSSSGRYALKLSHQWDSFLASVMLHTLLPLLPIALELWQTGKVVERSLTLTASMYAISCGVTSRSQIIFGCAIVASLIFSVGHGSCVSGTAAFSNLKEWAWITISGIFVLNLFDKYDKHVVDKEPLFESWGNKFI